MDDEDDIHDRLERLEATVADQQQTIEQLTETPAVGRRSVVASLLGAGAVGGLAGYGSQSARAQASGPAGQVGTGEEPVDVEAWNLTVQNEADGVGGVENPLTETLEADGNDVTGVGALEAETAQVANTPSGDDDVLRYQEGVESGTVVKDNGEGLNAASDDGMDTRFDSAKSVTFSSAFGEAPNVVSSKNPEQSDARTGWFSSVFSASTTGADILFQNYGTTNHEDEENDLAADWIATRGR